MGSSSLGGAEFLQSFAAISDVKADIEWEDIIPAEERERAERVREEEEKAKAEEKAAQSKKRAAARESGAYEGMFGAEPSPPATSKQSKKSKAPAAPRKTAAQKSMELKGKLVECELLAVF